MRQRPSRRASLPSVGSASGVSVVRRGATGAGNISDAVASSVIVVVAGRSVRTGVGRGSGSQSIEPSTDVLGIVLPSEPRIAASRLGGIGNAEEGDMDDWVMTWIIVARRGLRGAEPVCVATALEVPRRHLESL